jgi:DNA-binding transcriptional LysR family regulator
LDTADEVARKAQPELRVGFVRTTGGWALARLVREFERLHPETPIRLTQIPYHDLYGALRDNLIDVLVLWRTDVEPGVTVGPTIDRQGRVAAMAADNPLVRRGSISVLDVQNWGLAADIAPRRC